MEKFLTDRVNELRAVTWPTKKQAVHSMITVLIIMLIIGVGITFIDGVFNRIILELL
ncbi:preprotein translocase subunit SecE [bacterium]|jgi:preprotein translocase SecE subunit|nr:preprotein translocase subunit SecE [bacterium]MBT6831503.1 preprotein translocase subunit SecE [bacterium]MBT6996057.1 preprotein translocase subunit SecE [bacterium]MBT7772178.1 preprotein translocase subunit SecE [bacterium]